MTRRFIPITVFCVVLLWLLIGRLAEARAASPVVAAVPLRLSAAEVDLQPRNVIAAPNGRLWLSLVPRTGEGTTLVEINLASGKTADVVQLPITEQAMTIGPDGNLWFAGHRASTDRLDIGYVNGHGQTHLFSLPLFGLEHIVGLSSGSDGALWFTAQDGTTSENAVLGRITTTGTISLRKRPRRFAWFGPLEPDSSGGFFTGIGALSGDLAEINSQSSINLISKNFLPYVEDRAGDIWGFTNEAEPVVRITPTGQHASYSWVSPTASGTGLPGAMVLGADGNVWFTGSIEDQSETTVMPGNVPVSYTSVFAEATDQGATETWPAPFVNAVRGPVGEYSNDQMIAGADGRLYSIGYAAGNTAEPHHWHLYAVTLPDSPTVIPAEMSLDGAVAKGHNIRVRLTCAGQSGRYCSGDITAEAGGSKAITHKEYALTPGLSMTVTLVVPVDSKPHTVVVTSDDMISHTTETRWTPIGG